MLSRFSYIEQSAQKKRVLYEGTSVIYQGMPVCYNYDTTDNIDGYDAASAAAQSTTAEGNQNEGKYVRVEDPVTTNLAFFAGVVAGTDKEGKTGDGNTWIEIYIPNGAVVPVRTDASTTVGVTVLGIANGSTLCASGGRAVAVAMETVDRSDTNGIVLAKLDQSIFGLNQTGVGSGQQYNGLTGAVANTLKNIFANTSGSAANLLVHSTVNGALAAAHNEWSILSYMDLSGTITAAGYTRCILAQLNLSGTINHSGSHQYALMAQLSGTPTFTATQRCAGIHVDLSLGVNPTSGDYAGIVIANNGANQTEVDHAIEIFGNYGINQLFSFQSCAGITANFISNGGTGGAETGITSGGDWKKIKVDIDGTDYYLLAMLEPVEVDMVS